MKPCITLGITARNEEACIAATLTSVLLAVAYAQGKNIATYEVVAILDECTDNTEAVVKNFPRVQILQAQGGLIEAQRSIAHRRPFVIFTDADILLGENVIFEVTRAMLDDPQLQVAYPTKRPLPPQRSSLMAAALYCYNRVEGFQKARRYFNGKLFAIRDWQAPTLVELKPRLLQLPRDRFYDFHAGLRVDDIWLSRDILLRYGVEGIREIPSAEIRYRPPETFTGMYRMYLRMRREHERLNLLFPESVPAHQQRGYDWEAERRAPWRDRLLWRIFRLALGCCNLCYRLEKFYFQSLPGQPPETWLPVTETKKAL
ncbi:glycosyltransferase [Prosthecobacter dejongeii]|uniref:Glycosyltransferase involved in cell wall biosynthesis n=1 Tax=Prosthecobacter dejongeii TaxID=48465 RepID=A0A7W7YI20_9BACT|nr:glycosyltransferase [Prosthecobacter dejongeii]MBB5036568.1 glycosyltransferase involved in cell wall biosynthesis [Prosthecobacter dejongeii]